jgi:hypothetical protein
MDGEQLTSSRRAFLRRLGTLAAAGIGLSAFVEPAFAQGSCCVADPPCTPWDGNPCQTGHVPHNCSGCGEFCCLCAPAPPPTCKNYACPCG